MEAFGAVRVLGETGDGGVAWRLHCRGGGGPGRAAARKRRRGVSRRVCVCVCAVVDGFG